MRRSAYASRNLKKRSNINKERHYIFETAGSGLNEEEVRKILGKKIKVELDKSRSIKKRYFK